jgi:hypothetical protein
MSLERPLESLSDDELLAGLADVLRQSRRVESSLIAHIAEVDERRLFARSACPSMFVYCLNVLHLSEGETNLRITVARAAREHPILLEMLADGRLHLSGIAKLAPVLTPENRDLLLRRAVHKSKRQIEELLAERDPRPDAPSVIRKLPERPLAPLQAEVRAEIVSNGAALPSPPIPDAVQSPVTRPVFEPLSPTRYKIQFTAGPELRDNLERLRALLRSEFPDGDLGAIVGRAVRELRQRLEARRFAQTSSPRKGGARATTSSRYLPREVRRAVYRRDGGRCRFVDAHGRRCPEKHRLEYHHRYPFGLGGTGDVDNICLMCWTHNRYLAELDYGKDVVSRHIDGRHRPRPRGDCGDSERDVSDGGIDGKSNDGRHDVGS